MLSERSRSTRALTHPSGQSRHDSLALKGLSASRLATCFVDGGGIILAANSALERLTGHPVAQLIGKPYVELVTPAERDLVAMAHTRWRRDGATKIETQRTFVRDDGTTMVVRVHVTQLPDVGDGAPGLLLQIDDITDERALHAALVASQAQLKAVVDASVDAIVVMDEQGVLRSANPATFEIFGWEPEALIGNPVTMLMPPAMRPMHEQGLMRYLRTGSGRIVDSQMVEVEGLHRDGTLVPVELTVREIRVASGRLFTGTLRDLRPRREFLQRLRHLAYEDALTGLPNSAALLEQLHGVIEADGRGSVLVCDIDGLASVNNSFGPAVGDALLVKAAARIREVCGAQAFLGRYRSAEFVVICEGGPGAGAALARRVADSFSESFDIDGREITASVSVGVALLGLARLPGEDEPVQRPETVLQRGECALQAAKRQGRNSIRTFDDALAATLHRRAELEQQLRLALAQDALEVHFQPIAVVPLVAGSALLEDARWVGLEALARWTNDDGDVIPPGIFIPIAESAGLIATLGRLVLDKAIHQGRLWLDELGDRAPRLSVNVSAIQLVEGDFVQEVANTLSKHRFPATMLVLELTESSTVLPGGLRALEQLRDLGVTLAVDDFGTEWSGLVRLRNQPFQELKVDRSFVVAAAAREQDASLLEGVLDLARRLDMRTVVEGVETPEQLDLAIRLGATVIQGYLLARPAAAADLHDELVRRSFAMTGPVL